MYLSTDSTLALSVALLHVRSVTSSQRKSSGTSSSSLRRLQKKSGADNGQETKHEGLIPLMGVSPFCMGKEC